MMRVLVVDDEEDIREQLRDSLEKEDHEVLDVGSAEEALRIASVREDSIDLILCDLQLPGKDGLSVLQSLEDARSTVPFAIMTAHGDLTSAMRALHLGAIGFITKPFGRKQIRDLINKVIAERGVTLNGHPYFLEDRLSLAVRAQRDFVQAAVTRIFAHFAGTLRHLRLPIRVLEAALQEAAFNALEHGSPSNGLIGVEAELTNEAFVMRVRDSGPGFNYRAYTQRMDGELPATGGRGIPLILAMVPEVSWSTEDGTVITMRQALDRDEVA